MASVSNFARLMYTPLCIRMTTWDFIFIIRFNSRIITLLQFATCHDQGCTVRTTVFSTTKTNLLVLSWISSSVKVRVRNIGKEVRSFNSERSRRSRIGNDLLWRTTVRVIMKYLIPVISYDFRPYNTNQYDVRHCTWYGHSWKVTFKSCY